MKTKSSFSSKKISTKQPKKSAQTLKKVSSKKTKINKKTDFFENQHVKQDLKSFYDKEAKKYAETRKKFWHEEQAILNVITPLFDGNKKVRILEFWCGSGRFATLLNQNFTEQFDYVGIDISEELLSYAKKDNPNLTFLNEDITEWVKHFEQESFDLIVGTSSFQHIPSMKERSFLMKNFYRLLNYDGILLMTNRSLSSWFVKKNRKIVWKTRLISRLKLWKWNARDLLVPRTDMKWKIYNRFYHFFSLKELEKLTLFSGLSLKIAKFIDENGQFTNNEKISRSSLLVAKKSPIE